MALYHITPAGPRQCKAELGGCPYSKNGGKHYENPNEAQKEYQTELTDQYGTLGAKMAKKVNSSRRQKLYRQSYALKSDHPMLKRLDDIRTINRHTPRVRKASPSAKASMLTKTRKALTKSTRRMMNKNFNNFKRKVTPTPKNLRRLLLTKYWLPDIHSNKWK